MKNLTKIAETYLQNQSTNVFRLKEQWDREVSSLVRIETYDKSVVELAGFASVLSSVDP